MTDDLVAWLTAQLDHDEVAARAAESGPWSLRWQGQDHQLVSPGKEWPIAEWTYAIRTYGDDVHEERADCDTATQQHIALHDPARVLREITAKKAIIAGYRPKTGDPHPGLPCINYEGQDPEHYDEYDSCWRHVQAMKTAGGGTSRETLLHMAAVYADRPGYDEAIKR